MAMELDPNKAIGIQEYRTSEVMTIETQLHLLDEKSALAEEILEQIKDIHTLLVDESK